MAMTDVLEIMQQMAHKRVSTTTKEEIDRALSENSCLSPEVELQVLEEISTDD